MKLKNKRIKKLRIEKIRELKKLRIEKIKITNPNYQIYLKLFLP